MSAKEFDVPPDVKARLLALEEHDHLQDLGIRHGICPACGEGLMREQVEHGNHYYGVMTCGCGFSRSQLERE